MSARKNLLIVLLFLLLLSIVAGGCTPATPTAPVRASQKSVKGMELYSWQGKDGQWKFALLEGTNRNKTVSEVIVQPKNIEEIKAAFSRLAVGEQVVWVPRLADSNASNVVLAIPPVTIVRQLKSAAEALSLTLSVPDLSN